MFLIRLEIEAEPWMEGVLEVLMRILTPATTEDNSALIESLAPNAQTAEQQINDHSASLINDYEKTEKSIQSHFSREVGDGNKTAEDSFNCVLLAALHSGGSDIADVLDGNVARVDTSGEQNSTSRPQSDVPLSSRDIVLDSSLMNSAAVTENENVDACISVEESLVHSLPLLSTMPLTVPVCPPRYLKLNFLPDETLVSAASLLHFSPF